MRFPRARRWLKRLLVLAAAAACVFVAGAIYFAVHCSAVRGRFQPSPASSVGAGIAGYARAEDASFLEYAEWYIVWSYREKATWQQAHEPSGFPYFGAIGQYWSGYCCSFEVVRGRYPFNLGDHVMLAVIGTSFTLEYALKGAYEESIGRFTEWTAGNDPVEEDRYAARVARNYGDFVEDRPFYEFSFGHALRGLWSETKLGGPHAVRKWERKLWLSLDYGVEALYCGAIELASHAAYGVEDDVTYVWIEHAPETTLSGISGARIEKRVNADSFIARLPRYQKFTDAAQQVVRSGGRFIEIAGNRQIMVTAIVVPDWKFHLPDGELLFETAILTDHDAKRVALRIPVASLGAIIGTMPLEHIYDY